MPQTKYLGVITAIFATCLVVSNIIAVKVGNFGGVFLTVAVILFPLTYIINDVLTEVYGYAAARRVLWTGFGCNLLAVIAIAASIYVPAAPFFGNQAAYEAILGFSPRLLIASFVAFLAGGFTNAYIMAKMKIWSNGKNLWQRTIGSTIVGEGVDTAIFTLIAFLGVFPGANLVQVILGEWVFKTLFEAVATPFTYLVVARLKRAEGIDVYDRETNFSPVVL
jgi:uncharacterized integral membrane protein (TIGR00697 family)